MTTAIQTNPFIIGDPTARSLNRAQLVALPGLQLPAELVGLRGYPGLGAEAIYEMIRADAKLLGIEPDDPDPLRALTACFQDFNRGLLAGEIASDYGLRLGYFLLMLKRGDSENRLMRDDWTDAHWAWWRDVRHVMLAGGVMSGKFGRKALIAAMSVLSANGYYRMNIQQSPFGAFAGLVGLARMVRGRPTRALVLDCGQTQIKRGVATYARYGVQKIDCLPSIAAPCGGNGYARNDLRSVRARWDQLVELICQTVDAEEAQETPVEAVSLSIASYLKDGQPPLLDMGCYGSFQILFDHVESALIDAVAQRLGRSIPLLLHHDGTAAAAGHADMKQGIVLTLGTAIGVGFIDELPQLQALQDDFAVYPALAN